MQQPQPVNAGEPSDGTKTQGMHHRCRHTTDRRCVVNPNPRIFVCSAWTSLETVQEAVGQDYVIMWRQKASDVVFPDDVETIRRDLEQGCKQLQGFHYQIVLRELQTLSGHPDRLHEWTRAAIEMAAKYT